MAERLAYLEAVVGADVTQFRKGMRDIRNEVGFLSETMSGIAGLGRSLTFAFTTPVLALGTAAINVASSFEASMYNINSIAGLSADALDELGQKTLEFGARTRAGAQAASEALYTVFSAGITNVDDAFAVMQVATRTAEAGLADLTTTTEGLVAILLSYGDTSEAAANRASDAITRMVALGVGNMQTFMTALSSVVPTASAVGMEFDDLAADMAFLTQRGLSAARAGVSMNAVLTQMINPTEAMSAAFAELGARGLPDLIEQFGGVNEALMALIGTADGDVSVLFDMFNSIQARRAIGLFAEGQEAWQQTLADFEAGVAGSTTRAWEEQMKSFAATWDLLMSAVQAAGIAIGSTVLPVLQPFIAAITDLLLVIVDTNPELLGMGAAFLTVAAAIPPLLWLIGSLVTPFGVLLGAVSALGVAFATDFGGITTSVKATVDSIMLELQPLISTFKTLWDTIFPEDIVMGELPALTGDGDAAFRASINPDHSISLWEYYVDEGFIETMSWNEFMDLATEGGWDGGSIDVGEIVTLNWGGLVDQATDGAAMLAAVDWVEGDTIASDTDSLWENIAQGVAKAWPAMQTQLGILWDSFKTWLDETGANVLNSIASWFTVGAGTNIYTAFTELLQGDITGAINAVIPNAGTEIANAIGGWDLGAAFPKISQALSTLMTNVGNWFLTTGIPMLSQSMGYLSGRIAVLLYNAIQAGIAFFSSGGASDVASYVDEGIVDPFTTGFEQATAGTDFSAGMDNLTTAFTEFTDNIEMLAGIVDYDEMVEGFTDLADGIWNFVDRVTSADWTGLGLFLLAIGGFFLWAGDNLGGGIMSGWGSALDALGTSFADLADVFNNAIEGDFEGTTASLGAAFINFGFALASIPAGIVDGIINMLEDLWDVDLPSLTEWLDQMRAQIMGETAEVALTIPLNPSVQFDFTGDLTWDEFQEAMMNSTYAYYIDEMGTGQFGAIRDDLTGEVIGYTFEFTIDPDFAWTIEDVNAYNELQNLANNEQAPQALRDAANEALLALQETMNMEQATIAQQILMDAEIIVTPEGITYRLNEFGVYEVVPPEEPITTDTPVEVQAPITYTYDDVAANGMLTGGQANTVTGDEPIVMTVPEVQITPLSTSFASDIAGGTDVQTIITENFVPLEEAWVAMFAPEGAMQTTFNTFAGAVALGWSNIETEINDVVGLLNSDVPSAMATFESAKDPFIESLTAFKDAVKAAKDEVGGLKSELEGLLALESTMNVTITVTANSGEADGSHKTGLMSVPYDGYLAELHKGEMVLTRNEASQYRDADVSAEAAMPQTQSKGGDTYNNQVSIQSNLTVDSLLYELKRRGIDLTKMGKK